MKNFLETGHCEHCEKDFEFYLIHNGFNETTYAYCDKCGSTTLLNEHCENIPEECRWFFDLKKRYEKIDEKLEKFLSPCSCGGFFTRLAKPRCPHCNKVLSPKKAANYIENNSPGIKKGWIWQGTWNDLYSIIINNNLVYDNWKKTK